MQATKGGNVTVGRWRIYEVWKVARRLQAVDG